MARYRLFSDFSREPNFSILLTSWNVLKYVWKITSLICAEISNVRVLKIVSSILLTHPYPKVLQKTPSILKWENICCNLSLFAPFSVLLIRSMQSDMGLLGFPFLSPVYVGAPSTDLCPVVGCWIAEFSIFHLFNLCQPSIAR